TEIAALIPGDFSADKNDRDIIINHKAEGLRRITSLNPKFEALHFPILFPYGEDGFHTKIRYRGDNTSTDATKNRGDICADNLGNIILPTTYTGSPRYMRQLFLDSTSICQYFGNPHLFITFTCNSQWPEIVEAFSDTIGPHSECKPHIVARVFEMKLRLMKDQLDRNHFFGQTIAGANDTFYLRQLLTKVRGALSFVHLRTVNGTVCRSFKVACQKLGLLANDDEWLLVMNEVGQWGMCSLLRTLFVSMLMFCELANPIDLFNKTWELIAEDISYKYRRENRVYAVVADSEIVKNRLLQQLDHLLAAYTSSLAHFGLPTPTLDHSLSSTDHLLSAQLNYDAQVEYDAADSMLRKLNFRQAEAFKAIIQSVAHSEGNLAAYLTNRAIVAPTNEDVSKLNAYVLAQVPGPTKNYYSAYTLSSDSKRMHELETLYPTEFLNSFSFNGVPEHVVTLKVFTPIMLLRNLNPSIGLCNGTRIMTTFLGDYVIKGVIIGGSFEGSTVAIPRVVLNINDSRWPFILKRRQFPIRLCYGMTINKSQGQTLERVGIYLPKPVFSHGQLYVAISRVKSASGLRILLLNDPSIPHGYTRNIVYTETFNGIEASFTEPST
ncbi:ATP-dependent DNA helicase PIF1, partial [Linum perenne]